MGTLKNLRERFTPDKLNGMSNRLRLFTEATTSPVTYLVKWMTGLDTRGVVVVTVPSQMEDARVVAELSAARWLLEQKNVCGHDKTGAGLELVVSAGAIKKLARCGSAKSCLLRYAHFLRTRFVGAGITVENRDLDWIDFMSDDNETLLALPDEERLYLRGFGPVEITSHAIDKYAERFNRKITRAWREIRQLIQDDELVEVSFENRRSGIIRAQCSKYFFLPKKQAIFVVTSSPNGTPRLVTTYIADPHKRANIKTILECASPA